MSPYDGVVIGKLKLKGKPLNVKDGGGIKKKNKKHNNSYHHYFSEFNSGNHEGSMTKADDKYEGKGNGASCDDHLTPAEKRFLQQTEKLERQRLAKMANRSHRDRIQHFNQYLANLSEHYDIPKVGPG
ncbi:hypothetical protein TSUD_313530 [Trifolium subterraneum]|uniref:Protein FAM32A-like n=1 Tax=Trifolium subterraneum TaxID=3900 RepID=A0A2Z6M718_TRISU|nr:hypothetical protein TSUD_313530 [Trifolium subterraneum]